MCVLVSVCLSVYLTSIPNRTTEVRFSSCFSTSSTSGIAMENTVFENTFALLTSISDTVLPRPLGYCSVAMTGMSII